MLDIPVDTRSRFNVYKTSIRRRIDIETTSCVYWARPWLTFELLIDWQNKEMKKVARSLDYCLRVIQAKVEVGHRV